MIRTLHIDDSSPGGPWVVNPDWPGVRWLYQEAREYLIECGYLRSDVFWVGRERREKWEYRRQQQETPN